MRRGRELERRRLTFPWSGVYRHVGSAQSASLTSCNDLTGFENHYRGLEGLDSTTESCPLASEVMALCETLNFNHNTKKVEGLFWPESIRFNFENEETCWLASFFPGAVWLWHQYTYIQLQTCDTGWHETEGEHSRAHGQDVTAKLKGSGMGNRCPLELKIENAKNILMSLRYNHSTIYCHEECSVEGLCSLLFFFSE